MNEKENASIFYLIAAAPDLLALCKKTKVFLDNTLNESEKTSTKMCWDNCVLDDLIHDLDWNIAKAEGRGVWYND
jgi:hypothetical protein